MPTYKTPDVYIEEISVLPPSVAEVSTAVPAFIGYTERAERNGKSLFKKPLRINSFKEFQEIFGGRAPKGIKSIRIDEQKQVSSVTFSKRFYLHDALSMYFLNGGGCCYIVSLGDFSNNPGNGEDATLEALNALESEDEITLIVMPDLVSLGDSMYGVQQAALVQCAKLKKRFAILDIRETSAKIEDWSREVQTFRDRIGIMNLNYGAAYTPYIVADMGMSVTYSDICDNLYKGDASEKSQLEELDASEGTINAVRNIRTALADKKEYAARISKVIEPHTAADVGMVRRHVAQALAKTEQEGADEAKLTARAGVLKTILTAVYNVWSAAPPEGFQPLSADIRQFVRDSLASAVPNATLTHADFFNADAAKATAAIEEAAAEMAKTLASAQEFLDALLNVITGVYAAMESNIARYEVGLVSQCPLYCAIQTAVSKALCTMPPSAAVAGLYAQTDRQRGVWKAPANVSLCATQGLSQAITTSMQENLNVDAVAGKSVNALRIFPGKGILVWGARTLDGNSNEWRYVPVRRFFIMVEESIRRSSFWAVFEPNDANLWGKVKAMIENYLMEKWKDGALAGSAPADAFYVNVGLGSTMTSQDILEGRLIVDVAMAVVRPAEFIILRFMHKMQQS